MADPAISPSNTPTICRHPIGCAPGHPSAAGTALALDWHRRCSMAHAMRRKPDARKHDVTVIAESPETLDGLLGYLGQAGLVARGLRSLDAVGIIEATRAAVVLFPDAFEHPSVVALARTIRTKRADLLLVLVTGDAPRFQELTLPLGRSVQPQLYPKPAFGWTILDAIRHHTRAGPGGAQR
ncbi:MAG: hypothetical protein IPN17_08965 [Deltaproteobacteria bacterium]|nr:hypothetical protein [Deltaproteobacteria bacterium]